MAEEALKTAAKKLNIEIKVETNGASGVENAITPADLKDIYGVIIAADKDVNAERFNGLPVIEVPVKEAIHHPADLINKVISGQAARRQGISSSHASTEKYEQESFGRQVYKHLMSGVSNMLPFVVAGGILIAISFLWGIYSADPNSPQYNVIAATLMKVGQQASLNHGADFHRLYRLVYFRASRYGRGICRWAISQRYRRRLSRRDYRRFRRRLFYAADPQYAQRPAAPV